MPILVIVLIALLIGTVGFWDALGALLGAVAVIALFWILLIAVGIAFVIWVVRKVL